MSLPKFASIGWELADPRVADLRDADSWQGDAWNSVDLLFLSTRAIAGLWSELSPGDQPKLFPTGKERAQKSPSAKPLPQEGVISKPRKKSSAVREQAAWNRAAVFARNLRRLLRRGGLLICRLDSPTPRVKIRFPPLSKCFPDGKSIDSYLALSVVHATLAEWSMPLAVEAPRLTLVDADSPWSDYLRGQAGEVAPVAAILAESNTAAVLARDGEGRILAAADSQVVLLPPLATPDPQREVELLLDAALRARSLRQSSAPRAMPAEAAADLERLRLHERRLDEQIERLRRERESVRRALRQREQLGDLIASVDASQFAAAVAQALAILGMAVRGADATLTSPSRLSADSQLVVEAIPSPSSLAPSPSAVGTEESAASYVVSGRLRRSKRSAAPVGTHAGDRPARRLRMVTESAGDPEWEETASGEAETVVPARELFQAAMAVLASPEDDTLPARIRQSLHETHGVYRFAE